MLPDWKNIEYLQHGSAPQQLAYRLLHRYELLVHLQRYDPVLVGTFPLDLTVPGSDLDIICEVHDVAEFRQVLEVFAELPEYGLRQVSSAVPATVASFEVEGMAVEVFGQPVPTTSQNGYRHMVVEARLLAAGGLVLKQQVLALKASGVKTEPAFAQILGLSGDPYQALLALENDDDAALAAMVSCIREDGLM